MRCSYTHRHVIMIMPQWNICSHVLMMISPVIMINMRVSSEREVKQVCSEHSVWWSEDTIGIVITYDSMRRKHIHSLFWQGRQYLVAMARSHCCCLVLMNYLSNKIRHYFINAIYRFLLEGISFWVKTSKNCMLSKLFSSKH